MPNTNVLSTVTTFERESTERASAVVGIVLTGRILGPRTDPGRRGRADLYTANDTEWGNGRAYDADENTISSRG